MEVKNKRSKNQKKKETKYETKTPELNFTELKRIHKEALELLRNKR